MNVDIKKYKQAFLLFTIAQLLMVVSLLENGSSIKALSDLMILFGVFHSIGFIMMVIASAKLYDKNKNYFYALITSIICIFVSLLALIATESTEDMTVAWSRGLAVSADILICITYAYFFLGSKEQFLEFGLEGNSKRSRLGFIFVIAVTIVINLMSFIGSFQAIKTNYLAAAIFKYGRVALKLFMYVFMFVILITMMVDMKKKFKNEKEEEAHEEKE